MAILTDEVKQLLKEQGIAFVATTSKDGIPNVSVKGSIQVIDDDTLAFACIWSEKTMRNLEDNPQIAIALADTKALKGFQVKGKAVLENSGPLFDRLSESLAKMKLPPPKSIAKIAVTELYQWPPARA